MPAKFPNHDTRGKSHKRHDQAELARKIPQPKLLADQHTESAEVAC